MSTTTAPSQDGISTAFETLNRTAARMTRFALGSAAALAALALVEARHMIVAHPDFVIPSTDYIVLVTALIGTTVSLKLWLNLRFQAGVQQTVFDRLEEAKRFEAAIKRSKTQNMLADNDFKITFVMPGLEDSLAQSKKYWDERGVEVGKGFLLGHDIDIFHKQPRAIRDKLKALTDVFHAKIALRRAQLRPLGDSADQR
jgi:hypothetical protein